MVKEQSKVAELVKHLVKNQLVATTAYLFVPRGKARMAQMIMVAFKVFKGLNSRKLCRILSLAKQFGVGLVSDSKELVISYFMPLLKIIHHKLKI